jgi:hypothetical protein
MAYLFYMPLVAGLIAAFALSYQPILSGVVEANTEPQIDVPTGAATRLNVPATVPAVKKRNPYRFGRRR